MGYDLSWLVELAVSDGNGPGCGGTLQPCFLKLCSGKRARLWVMAPVMSKERDFAAVHRKREAAAAVSFESPDGDASHGVAWGTIVEVMKTTADLPVVPAVPRRTQLVNFDDFYDGRGHLMKARRPASKECAMFVVGMLDASLKHSEAATLALFRPTDQGLLEELGEMYVSIGKAMPKALVEKLASIRGKPRQLRREYRVSPTFMVKDTVKIDELEERSRELFGVGLNVLAGPLNFIYQNRKETVAHCRTLLGRVSPNLTGAPATAERALACAQPVRSPPRAELKPPPVSGGTLGVSHFKGDAAANAILLDLVSEGAIATAPPYEPANPKSVHVLGDYVWVPTRKKWCETDTRAFEAPPVPADQDRDVVYKNLVWHAKARVWLKLKH